MDLLQAFYFTFSGDAKSLDDALDEANKKSKGLEDNLQGTDKIASKLGASFLSMAKSAGTALTGILALGALKKLTLDTADHTYAVYQQARAMGVSTEVLSTWQHTVVSAGGTAGQAAASMETLRSKFIELTRFGGVMGQDAFMFRKLGLTPAEIKASVKDPTIALVKLSETFGKLNQTQALFLGKRLGLDPATIALLSQGRRALEEQIDRQKRLGVVTTEQAMAAAQFKMQTAELGTVLETVGREITTAVLPPLTWLLKKTEDMILYFRDHKSFVIAFFVGIATVVSAVYLPAIVSAAIATWTLIAPFVAVAAAVAVGVTALALFADDLYNFMEGNNSVIGTIAKKWPWFGEIVRGVVHNVGAILATLQSIIFGTFEYLGDLITFLVDVFTKGPSKALDLLNEKTAKIFKDILGHFKAVISAIKETAGGIAGAWDWITGGDKKAKDYDGPPSAAPKVTKAGTASPEAIAAANAAQDKYGVPAAVTLAQYQLESGNGAHMPAGSNNPFGIKAKAGQPYVEAMTTEVINGKSERVMQRFAKFDSLQDAFEAHAKLLATGGAYANARKHADDPNAYADALTGKYATDPQYGAKLRAIIAQQHANAAATASPPDAAGGVSGSKPNTTKNPTNAIKAAQTTIAATNVPMSTQGSGTIANNSSSNRTTTVDVGGVTVHAPGADGAAIGQSVGGSLEKHLAHAVDQSDDGVVI